MYEYHCLFSTSVTSEDGQNQLTAYRGLNSSKYVTNMCRRLGAEWAFCAAHATNAKIFQII